MVTWRLGMAIHSDFPRKSVTVRLRWSGARGHVLDDGLVRRGRGFVQLTEPTVRSVLWKGSPVEALEPGALAVHDAAPCVHLAPRMEVWSELEVPLDCLKVVPPERRRVRGMVGCYRICAEAEAIARANDSLREASRG
ncbi:MAG: hypothetical protein CL931_01145 [Deltaproteobacteria bacterium]|nr:hypothetical protein [Deltaproteobacteria bacterium]